MFSHGRLKNVPETIPKATIVHATIARLSILLDSRFLSLDTFPNQSPERTPIMKKLAILAISMLIAISALAQTGGGFVGPGAGGSATTVQQALSMRDDTPVVLTGKIVSSLGDEKYLFRDATGEIIIEIDDDDWRGITVTPDTTLEIVGEVDKEFMDKTKIDVNSFSVK